MSRAMMYKAFVSYKHQQSTQFARRLELALKRYAKPWYVRPMRIFRDENHLVPSSDLPEMIRSALEESEFLILLASPEAAESNWVQDELEHWCSDPKRQENLIIILTSGSIVIDSRAKVIDWDKTDALPRLLASRLDSVPLYVDLTWAQTSKTQSLSHPEFKRAINSISARLRGVDPNEMLGVELREYRRNWRWAAGAVVALLGLIVASGILGYRAYFEATQREQEQASEELATRARTAMSDNAMAGLMLSLAALEKAMTPDALQALSTALSITRLRGTLLSDKPETVAAAFSPDGNVVGTVAKNGTVQFWSAETKLRLFELPVPITEADTISFSSAGDRVFVSGPRGICGWTVPDLAPLGCWTRETLLATSHSPDGRSVTLSGVGLEWVDVETDDRSLFPGLETVTCGPVRFSLNGLVMAVAVMPDKSENSGVLLVHKDDGGLRVHRSQPMVALPMHLALSSDGARILTVDSNERVILSDGFSGATLSVVEHEARVVGVGFSPKGRWAAAFDENGQLSLLETATAGKSAMLSLDNPRVGGVTAVKLVNEAPWILVSGVSGKAVVHDSDGRVLFELSGGSRSINGIALSPDAQTALTFGNEDLLWDLLPTSALYTLWAHEGSAEVVRFCSEDRSLLTGGADGAVRLWNLATTASSTLMMTHKDWVTWLECFARPNLRILSAGLDGTMNVLDGEHRWTFDLHQAENSGEDTARWIWDAAVSANGRRAATVGQDGVLVISRMDPPGTERRWAKSNTPLTSVALSANGEMVAVGNEAGAVYLYSPETDEAHLLFRQQSAIMELVFSPDERFLLSVSAGTAQNYDLTAKKVAHEIRHDDSLTTGAFSPDGIRFVTGGLDRAARVWDTANGELIRTFDEHLDGVTVTRFVGPRRLITGSSDGRVRVWNLDTGDLVALLEFGNEVRGMDVSSDLRLVAIALADGRVVVWPCVACGDIEDARSLGYKLAAPVMAQGRLDGSPDVLYQE